MQNTNWEKTKPWLWQGALIGTMGLIAWFGIRLLFVTIHEKMNDIQKLSVTQEYRANQLERLPDLEKQHELIQEHAGELNIILDKEHLVNFIEQLEALAVANKVKIEIESRDNAFLESKVTINDNKDGTKTAFSDKEEEPSGQVKKGAKDGGILAELPLKKFLKLTITLTGGYEPIVEYIHQLEEMPFALDVTSMNIKVHPEEAESVTSDSGILNPFQQAVLPPIKTPLVPLRLDATLELAVYTKE